MTELKILEAHPDQLQFAVTPTNLIDGSNATMTATVLDHWGDPVPNAIVRLGVENDGQSGSVAATAQQADAAAPLQATDVVTLTTDAAGQVSAVFTKDAAAMGSVGVRAELLFDDGVAEGGGDGSGLHVALEERRVIILSQSGLFTRDIFLPTIQHEE